MLPSSPRRSAVLPPPGGPATATTYLTARARGCTRWLMSVPRQPSENSVVTALQDRKLAAVHPVVHADIEQKMIEAAAMGPDKLHDRRRILEPCEEEQQLLDVDAGKVHAIVRLLVGHTDRLAGAQLG